MSIVRIMLFLGIIYLVFSGGKGMCCMGQHGRHSDTKNAALEELKSRYIKGEINKKEFEQKKKDIA